MKKIHLFLMALSLILIIGCDFGDDTSNESAPAADGKLSVTVTYNGTFGTDADGTTPGTMKNYAYLYDGVDPLVADGYPILYTGSTSTNGGTITFNNLPHGDYYIIAFYDFKGRGPNATDDLNKTDRYALYDGNTGSPLAADAVPVSVNSTDTPVTINIEADWGLKSSNTFLTVIP
jgi:hypothetical protein